MTKEEFIKIISKYININDYDIRFKKSPYYKNENEMWLYKKDDKEISIFNSNNTKKIITGYKFNDKLYKSLKEMRNDFISGIANSYEKVYEYKNFRIGLLVKEEDLTDEEYLNIALNG